MKINVLEILLSSNKEDFLMVKGPIFMLLLFFFIGAFFFPKTSSIYKDGNLRTCKCFGVQAAPRVTKGSKIGDVYCLGIPFKCSNQKIMYTN